MTDVFKALSDPTRRKVLQLLRIRPRTAGELAEHFDVTWPTMSAHFAVLTGANLIRAEKHGRSITYRLKMSVLEEALLGFSAAFGLEIAHSDNGGAAATEQGGKSDDHKPNDTATTWDIAGADTGRPPARRLTGGETSLS
jgi:DNA-binding transcriptional ArsR family regulator